MTQRSKSQYAALYGSSGSIFPDNTTGEIAEGDMRQFGEDQKDSLFFHTDDAYTGAKGVKNSISTITNLKAVVTLSLTVPLYTLFRDTSSGNVLRVYELVSGTDAESSPDIIRPDDYAGTTNEKVWKLAATGGAISGLTANRVPYATGASTLGDDSALTWDATNNALTVSPVRIFGLGTANTFVGETAGNFTTTAAFITAIGRRAGLALTDGSQNTLIGANAGEAITGGDNNTMVGHGAGLLCTGDANILIGKSSAAALTSGGNNINIGTSTELPSNTLSNQLNVQNAIYGSSNGGTGTTMSTGIVGLYCNAVAGSWQKATFIGNVGVESTAVTNGIVVYAKDSSDGSANSTLAIYAEQAPEATGTFTQTHRLKIWVNGVEYYLSLDAV